MNIRRIIALFVAVICIALGFFISSVRFSSAHSTPSLPSLVNEKLTPVKHSVRTPFQNIHVSCIAEDVCILPSEDGYCSVTCLEGEGLVYSVEVQDNTLRISCSENNSYNSFLPFGSGKPDDVRIYLPQESYSRLEIRTVSGDVKVPAGFYFAEAVLQTNSGSLSFRSSAEISLSIKSTSGSLLAYDVKAGAIDAESSSGDIRVLSLETADFFVKTTSGEIHLDDVSAAGIVCATGSGDQELYDISSDSLKTSSTSGEIELKNVVVAGGAIIQSTSGDIELDACDAASLSITSTSGSVKGSLVSGKDFEVHSTSGSIRVPSSEPGKGRCIINTTSGNIKIEIDS